MANRETALRSLAVLALTGAACFGAYEIHRGRVALEATRAATEASRDRLDDVVIQVLRVKDAVESLKPAPARASCPKAASHLDHDVDLGTPHECPDAPGVTCVTYQGTEMTGQVAEARCKAGKL